MSLHAQPINAIPEQTVAVAKAAFRKGNIYMTMRDELGVFHNLAHPIGVGISGVKEVDAQFQGTLDKLSAALFIKRPRPALRPLPIAHAPQTNAETFIPVDPKRI